MKKLFLFYFFLFCFFYHNCCTEKITVPLLGYHHPNIPREDHLRTSQYPYLSGDTFRFICNFKIDETCKEIDTDLIKEGDLIFIRYPYLEFFFEKIHPYIQVHYIIISHNSIEEVPGPFIKFLDDSKIIAWFGKNAFAKDHSKVHPIPLGLADKYWHHGNVLIVDKIRKKLPLPKKYLLYMNFFSCTHKDRGKVYDFFCNKKFCYKRQAAPFASYLSDLAESKFVLSPRGAGIDCHRTWEAMLMGCIPIIKKSPLEGLYGNLPVLLIDDWSSITENFLNKKYEEMQKQDFHMEKLFAEYWLKKIFDFQKQWKEKKGFL